MIGLSARGVHRSFRRGGQVVHAVRGVDIEVAPGEVVGLVGRSGSGKTTLVHLLVGVDAPDAGTIERPGGTATPAWSEVAFVPQHLGLLDELTMEQNVVWPLRLAARDDERSVGELLTALDIAGVADRRPRTTSLGQQQRAAVARALVVQPRVLVADEPTSHLDEEAARLVLHAILHARDAGTAVLLCTHDRRLLPSVDRIVELFDGRVVGSDLRVGP